MAVSSTPVLVQTPKITPITIVNGTGTGLVVAATAGSNGAKLTALWATSSDTSDRVIQIWLTRSATNYLLGSVNVPTLAGTDGVVAIVDLLAALTALPVDNDGQRYLFMESGDTLSVGSTVTVTSAKTVTVTSVMGNF